MKQKNKTLKKARQMLASHRPQKTIHLLEPQINYFRDEVDYFYLLGRAYFTIGDLSNAELYLGRALRCEREHAPTQLTLAALYFKRRDSERALKIWLNQCEINDAMTGIARRGLKKSRYFLSQPDRYYDYVRKHKRVLHLLPPLRSRFSRFITRLLPFVLLGLITLSGYMLYNRYFTTQIVEIRSGNELTRITDLPRYRYIDIEDETARYNLTIKQVEELMQEVRSGFDDHRDNAIRPIVNRLLFSNAAAEIKTMMSTLSGLLTAPEIFSIQEEYGYADVVTDPWLYDGCHILWSGRITNLREEVDKQQFQFLVGYTDGTILEGMVDVEMEKPTLINELQNYQLFAQIIRLRDESFMLRGITLRPLND